MTRKAAHDDFVGRFREIVSDPLNLLIERVPAAGFVERGMVILHNGHRVPLTGPGSYYGDFSEILVINRGVHEPLEEYVFQQTLTRLPAAPVMLELGAYWAHYSMWLKKARPASRVVMVEPEQPNLLAGKANFASNGMSGEFVRAFVGKGKFEVDRFVREQRLARLDVLHSDIQGFECEMLDGAKESLGNGLVTYLFVSTHSQDLHQKVVKRVRGFDYRIEVSGDFDRETTSNDGFVFASHPSVPPVLNDFAVLGREEICLSSARQRLEYLTRLAHLTRDAEPVRAT